MPGTVIVVGASSGIGAALARSYALEGRAVALLARSSDKLDTLASEIEAGGTKALALQHDVADSETVPALFERIELELGPAEILIYAAGILPREETAATMKATVEVGLSGAMAWLHEAARRFEERRAGSIVGISSIAGDRGRQAYPAYHAAKAGLSAILESLHYRLHRHGVSVVTIKPGFIDTAMTQGMEGLFWLISPREAAEIIVKRVRAKARVAYVPARWRLVSWVVCLIPAFLMRRMRF